ncbi:MAG: hypothetical protein CVU88_02155, partial [Firmicutes bacterium HGW-Firmicutes-13]
MGFNSKAFIHTIEYCISPEEIISCPDINDNTKEYGDSQVSFYISKYHYQDSTSSASETIVEILLEMGYFVKLLEGRFTTCLSPHTVKERSGTYLDKADLLPYGQEYIDFLDIERGLARRTIEEYWQDLYLFIEYMKLHNQNNPKEDGPLQLEEITTDSIRCFLSYLKEERNNSTRARNRKLASLRSYFEFLESNDYLAGRKDPTRKIRNAKTPKTLPVFLSLEESGALIKAARINSKLPYRDYAMMRLFLQTGCRVSELTGLETGDIDFIEEHVLLKGKGSKERYIPLTESTSLALKDYLERRLPASQDIKKVFLNHKGVPITRRGVQTVFNRTCKEAGLLKPNLSAHKLRHT